jgi:hypothetical protein
MVGLRKHVEGKDGEDKEQGTFSQVCILDEQNGHLLLLSYLCVFNKLNEYLLSTFCSTPWVCNGGEHQSSLGGPGVG